MGFPTITGIILTNTLDVVHLFVPFKVDIQGMTNIQGMHNSDSVLPGFLLFYPPLKAATLDCPPLLFGPLHSSGCLFQLLFSWTLIISCHPSWYPQCHPSGTLSPGRMYHSMSLQCLSDLSCCYFFNDSFPTHASSTELSGPGAMPNTPLLVLSVQAWCTHGSKVIGIQNFLWSTNLEGLVELLEV